MQKEWTPVKYPADTEPPNLTPEDLWAKAREMRPMLLEEQENTEKRGTYSPAVRDAFHDAGFYKFIHPKKYGGFQFGIRDYYKLIVEIARGCPSTAWCYALGTGKSLMIASFYPEEVQKDIHERVGVIHAGYGPGRSAAKPVDGGYMVSGNFNYCSGIPYANHLLCTAPVDTGDADKRVSTWAAGSVRNLVEFMVPKEHVEIIDDWGDGRTLGLNGSGSFSARIKDEVFVPESHVIPDVGHVRDPFRDIEKGTVGYQLHGDPMYLGYVEYFLTGEITAVMVGAGQAMLDEVRHLMGTRAGVGGLYGNHYAAQAEYGEALKLVDGAEAILYQGAELGMEYSRNWERTHELPTQDQIWRIANMFQLSNLMCWEAGLIAFRLVGTTPIKTGQRVQRYFRDLAQERGQATVTGRMFRDSGLKAHLGLNEEGKFPTAEPTERRVRGGTGV